MNPHDDDDDWEPLEYEECFKDVATAIPVPPRFVIKDLIPVGLTFVGGPPKDSKKSTITMAIAAATAGYECGALPPHMRVVERGGTVMVFSAEASAGELNHMLTKGMHTDLKPTAGIIVADDPWLFRLDTEEGRQQFMFWLNGRKPRMVILDPFKNFHDTDEKDGDQMFKMIQPLRQWAVENDAAVLIVHHTRKLDDVRQYTAQDMRGSSTLFGAADGVLMITPVDPTKMVVRIHATFKRGLGWERTLKLAVYSERDRPASEVLSPITAKVLEAYQAGCKTSLEVSKQIHVAKTTVLEHIDILVQNGLLLRDGKKIRIPKRKQK